MLRFAKKKSKTLSAAELVKELSDDEREELFKALAEELDYELEEDDSEVDDAGPGDDGDGDGGDASGDDADDDRAALLARVEELEANMKRGSASAPPKAKGKASGLKNPEDMTDKELSDNKDAVEAHYKRQFGATGNASRFFDNE